jgi:hypothetical protein
MHGWVVLSFFLAVGGALSMALPAKGEQQDPSGQTTQMPGVTGRWMSCEETYGKGWETCGAQVSFAARSRRGVLELTRESRIAGLAIVRLWAR